jgi:hypothetical protein
LIKAFRLFVSSTFGDVVREGPTLAPIARQRAISSISTTIITPTLPLYGPLPRDVGPTPARATAYACGFLHSHYIVGRDRGYPGTVRKDGSWRKAAALRCCERKVSEPSAAVAGEEQADLDGFRVGRHVDLRSIPAPLR